MPPEVLNAPDVARFLTRSAKELRGAANELDALDAAIGDGDHGSSVATLFETAVGDTDFDDPSAAHLVTTFGHALMRHCSGASGTLYAVLFTTVGTTLESSREIRLPELARSFRSGLDRILQVGGANLGDATLVDALTPFVGTLEGQSRDHASLPSALDLAAVAAKRGALSTSTMVARMGRAKNFGEGSRGHQDPGATSFAVIADAWRYSL